MTDKTATRTGIFINYRRTPETRAYARLLTSSLQNSFPIHSVFRDLDKHGGIKPAEDYTQRIQEELNKAGVILALIGNSWVDEFSRRLRESKLDYVRKELEIALSLDKPVLPVLIGAATMPSEQAVPSGLAQISRLHALRLTDDHFETEVQEVVRSIRRILGVPEKQETSISGLDKRLLDEASKGALKSIKLLLSQGANVDARDEEGATPLILAAANGHARTVSTLCERGASVNATTIYDVSALLAAVLFPQEPNVLVVKALLDAGASIELTNDSGVTPLLAACHRGNYDIVTLLLDRGANPDVYDENGSFPSAQWMGSALDAGVPPNLIHEVVIRLLGKKKS